MRHSKVEGSRESQERLTVVKRITEEIGRLLLDRSAKHNELGIEFKRGDSEDPVTNADRDADLFARRALLEAFPDDLVLSEEHDEAPVDFDRRIWMVDPLDGTKNYLRGGTGYSVNIGLWDKDHLQFGIAYAPARKEWWYADRSSGVFFGDGESWRPIRVSTVDDLPQAKLITRQPTSERRPLDTLVDKLTVRERIPESGTGIKLGMIADGRADAHINTNFRASKWDTAAPQIILEMAGGRLTDLDGRYLDYRQAGLRWERSFIGSNGLLHDQLLNTARQEST